MSLPTDAEFEVLLDELGATDELRRIARSIRAEQLAAVEQERESKVRAFLDAHLPEYMERASATERQALRLESEGGSADDIEHWTFNGIPRGAHARVVYRRVLGLRAGRRPINLGTMTLVSAAREGVDRGTAAGRRTFAQTRAEADRFGTAEARRMLIAAGWDDSEIEHDD